MNQEGTRNWPTGDAPAQAVNATLAVMAPTRRRHRRAGASSRSDPNPPPTATAVPAEPDSEPVPTVLAPSLTAPTAVAHADAPLTLVGTGRWSRFLNSALEHVHLTEMSARNAAVAQFFDDLWVVEDPPVVAIAG